MLSAPDDWTYFSEGGKHAIFTCRRLVLRVQKTSLLQAVQSAFVHGATISEQSNEQYDRLEEEDITSISERFRTLIVEPFIGSCYFDEQRTLLLPARFCVGIYRNALSSGNIPESRLNSWQTTDVVKRLSSVKATLLRNHTRLKLNQLFPSGDKAANPVTLSVEIKPKAGYLTSSPLVLPEHRCKYYHSRYSLQQELMEKGVVKKGWCQTYNWQSQDDNHFTRSSYSPLDLFCGEFIKINCAVAELSKNMQNNFRVWCDGVKVFGEYDTLTSTEYNELLIQLFGTRSCNMHESDARSFILDFIVHVVAKVLYRERLLERLLSLQRLDIIDGDGAVLVYKRLVALFGGSQTDAEMAIEQYFGLSNNATLYENPTVVNSCLQELLPSSPYTMPKCSHLHDLLKDIQQFQTHLQEQRQSGIPLKESIADEYNLKCKCHVGNLPKESCIFLLSNWLLSLTMCDVSFFVTFTISENDDMNLEAVIERHQTKESAGLFVCGSVDCESRFTRVLVQYEVKVIDYDPKPVTKLRNRQDVEKLFASCKNH